LFNSFEQVPVPGVTKNRYLTVRRTWGWLSEGRNLLTVMCQIVVGRLSYHTKFSILLKRCVRTDLRCLAASPAIWAFWGNMSHRCDMLFLWKFNTNFKIKSAFISLHNILLMWVNQVYCSYTSSNTTERCPVAEWRHMASWKVFGNIVLDIIILLMASPWSDRLSRIIMQLIWSSMHHHAASIIQHASRVMLGIPGFWNLARQHVFPNKIRWINEILRISYF
jgi:hypothetical protein